MNHYLHPTRASLGEGNGNPFQYSCLENSRDRGAWWAAVYGVAQSRTWLKQLSSSSSRASLVAKRVKRLTVMQETWVPSLGRVDPLEKEIATHSSILAREIPWWAIFHRVATSRTWLRNFTFFLSLVRGTALDTGNVAMNKSSKVPVLIRLTF